MKYIKYLFLLFSVAVIRDVISYTSGANPGYTGAISEGNCTSCHSSNSLVSSGTKWDRVRMRSNIPSTGYLPDSTYTITITYAESGISKFGFQLTALDTTDAAAGTFSTADSRTSTSNTTVSGKTRYYIGQTTTGSARVATDSTAWTFKWKAPSTNVGKVKLYTTVNSTNNNGGSSGDYIYQKDFTVTPSTLLSVASAKVSDPVACSNGTNFAGSATNSPTSYLWEEKPTTGANTTLSTVQNPNIPLSAGKHTILFTATNAYGKSNTVTLNILVLASPPKQTTNPKGTNTLCSGDSLKVSVAGLNPTLFKQKWAHDGSTKTTIFLKDTGSYINLATSVDGCATATDPVKIVINQRPIAKVELYKPKSAYCVNSNVLWKTNLAAGDSVSIKSATGPFTADSILTTPAKLATPTEKFWVKSPNKCVSAFQTLKYSVIDSSSVPVLAFIDSQLTKVVFHWKSNVLAVQYICSKDSGKTWNYSGNNGLDTMFSVATNADKSPVSVWIRYSVNNDCGFSSTARFTATTKSCQPLDYSLSWTKGPLCVGKTTNLILSNLPTKYNVWIDGVSKGQKSEFNISLTSSAGKVNVSVVDSAQLVCGTTQKSISYLAESINGNQLIHSLDTLTPNYVCTNKIWISYDNDATSVKFAWCVMNSKRVSTLSNPDFSQISLTINSGDSVWLEGSTTGGCLAQSAKAIVKINPKPDATFTYTANGAEYSFMPADTTGEHLWYIQTGQGWLNYLNKPKVNLASYSNQTVRVYHDLTINGDSCFSKSFQDITLGELSEKSLIKNKIIAYPNPVSQGGAMVISAGGNVSRVVITDASGRFVRCATTATTTGTNSESAARGTVTIEIIENPGIYRVQCFNGDTLISQFTMICKG